jgi:uncharacterized membrane protein
MRARGPGAALVVRLAVIALVLAAPWLPPWTSRGAGRAVVYLVDLSASVGEPGMRGASAFVREMLAERDDEKVGVVAFAGDATVLLPLEAEPRAPWLGSAEVPRDGTDIASALRLARAALPTGGERRIVLLGDGRATRGDALDQVRRARKEGIEVDAVPLGAWSPRDPAQVVALEASASRVAQGEPVALEARVRGEPSRRARVRWLRDGRPIGATTAHLDDDGVAKVSYRDRDPGPGIHVYAAAMFEAGERKDLRGERHVAVAAGGKPRALVLSVDGTLATALGAALDPADFDTKPASVFDGLPEPALLSGYDLVLLDDVPVAPAGEDRDSSGLTPRVQEALVEYVRRGGGVIATGGAFGFAPEYAGTPLSRMLPVEIQDQGQVEDPRVAMAIMLDRSGSMSARVEGGHTKLRLAVEAALASAAALRADDLLAIGTVDEETHWDAPLGLVSALGAKRDAIRSTEAGGGGIFVFTALADAYRVLAAARTAVRHVILFSDTADSEEKEESCTHGCAGAPRTAIGIASLARAAGISTSVVGIGNEGDQDTAFLRALAAAAGGRFYITGNATDLRRIFVSETRVTTRSNLREGPVEVVARDEHPILAGVEAASIPALAAYVQAKRRTTAATPIATRAEGRPVLASWRYGLGQVVALTTDVRDAWSRGWARHEGAGRILRQAVRFAIRRQAEGSADVRVAVHGRDGHITVDVAGAEGEAGAEPGDRMTLEAFSIGADGASRPLEAEVRRTAPGRYAARVRTDGSPFVLARARDASGALLGEGIGRLDAAGEMDEIGPDTRVLREIAREGGGLYAPRAGATLRPVGTKGKVLVPTWPAALIAAAAMTAIDVWLRRVRTRVRAEPAASFHLPVRRLPHGGAQAEA